MPVPTSPPRLATLVALTAVSTLTLNMFLPALVQIAEDLDADYGTVSMAIAGYLAVTALVQMVVGPLSDRVGRRPVLLASIAVFVLASVGCALSQDVWVFLGFRVLQAAMITGHALSLAIVRDTTAEDEAAARLSLISMAMAIVPMLGPLAGGLLDTALGWRAIFWTYAGVGAALLVWSNVDVGETRVVRAETTEAKGRLALLEFPRFWAYALTSAFSTGSFFVFLTGAPLVAARDFGVSTAALGWYIGSITFGFFCGSAFSNRFSKRLGVNRMMIAGRVVGCAGPLLGLMWLTLGFESALFVFGSTILVGVGNGITTPNANAGALNVNPDLAGQAAGLGGAMVVSVGACLTWGTGLLMDAYGSAWMLLGLLLAATLTGLALSLWARSLQQVHDVGDTGDT